MRAHGLLLSLAVVLTSKLAPAHAEPKHEQWEALESSDGVRAWKRTAADGSSVLKGETDLAADLALVGRVLQDVEHYTQWMHKCVESVELQRTNPSEVILYNRTDSPWPVKDRDVILTLTSSESPGGDLLFTFKNIRSDLKPEVEGVVRVPKMVGHWRLSKIAPNRTKAVYQLQTDVGGAVPRWASKGTLERIPFETLRGLRRYVAKLRS